MIYKKFRKDSVFLDFSNDCRWILCYWLRMMLIDNYFCNRFMLSVVSSEITSDERRMLNAGSK